MNAQVTSWLKPGSIVPVEPETIITLIAEVVRLRATLRLASSWMIPFDVMDETDRFEFDRAKQEVEDVLTADSGGVKP